MLKTLVIAGFVAFSTAQFVLTPIGTVENPKSDWPKVDFVNPPFSADLVFYTEDNGTLTPNGAKAVEIIDNVGNREKLTIWMDVPNLGYT